MSRYCLWRFDGGPGELSLLCFASRAVGQPLDTRERRLTSAEYRECFNTLVGSGMYVCHDAQADPHLEPLRANYLLPNIVLSILGVAFMVTGRAYGTVCCEQTDALRTWQPTEAAAVRAIVAKLAMLMAGAGDPALWGSPSVPMVPI